MDPTTTRQPPPAQRTEPVRARREAASALILVPAMMLVLFCLGGIAIDMTLVHGAHRSAHRVVSAAADDAAGMIDAAALQRTGELTIDPVAARQVALDQIDAMRLPGRVVDGPSVGVAAAGDTVTVAVTLEIDHVMLRAVPGHDDHEQIHVVAEGRLNR